jgi:hypothetical protein
MELLVALMLVASMSIFVLQAFMVGMTHAGRSNERTAAISLGMQVMEQIRASVNPYELVGYTSLTRSAIPLPAPYGTVVNSTPHPFEVAVVVQRDENLTLTRATVEVYRQADVNPFVTLEALLDDQ